MENKVPPMSGDDGNSCGSVSSTSVVASRRSSSQQISTCANNNGTGSPRRVQTPTPNVPTPTVTPTLRSTPSPSVSANSAPPNKIISRNVNGTMTVTSAPSNEAELQLYRVMQRASLLSYYDTLLEMGGDDVQQLCDAGEEEFLEIMALIGMASKPLHVRRLQKALQEWMTNPALFQLPLISINYNEFGPFPTSNPRLLFQQSAFAALRKDLASPDKSSSSQSVSPATAEFNFVAGTASQTTTSFATNPAASSSCMNKRIHSPNDASLGSSSASPSPGPHTPGSPLQLNPMLTEGQLAQICESAKRLSGLLPHIEPKPNSTKKKINKDLELIMVIPEDNPRRMEGIRKFSAIYGRFDCKRKAEKPLTLHEILVNEAAAQLCKYVPALLTRRDELFPLARQVVRDCDYHRYSKMSIGMSPARTRSVSTNSTDSETTSSGDISEVPIPAAGSKSPRSVGSSPGR